MLRDSQIPVLVVHDDGSVHRRAICQCGRVIYKKNVTTGECILQDKNYKSKLFPCGNQGEYTFECDCGIGHIVRDIKERTEVVDKVSVETDSVVI